MAKGWTIGGVGDPTREAASGAAQEAGLPLGAWVERVVREALRGEPEPAPAAGVELDELEAMVRVVAEELRPVQEALARLGRTAAPDHGSPVGFVRERLRQRRRGR